jgi:hypothetical protein
VEFHKHHIMVAFNLKINADLILFELKHGLIAVNPEPHQRACILGTSPVAKARMLR